MVTLFSFSKELARLKQKIKLFGFVVNSTGEWCVGECSVGECIVGECIVGGGLTLPLCFHG